MSDIEQGEIDGAASRVKSVGAKDSQNNVKLVVDMGDKGTMEIPLTGKLVAENYLIEMRGWLMTVAALFVTMSFQATLQPPGWMPKGNWLAALQNSHEKHYGTTVAASSSRADRPAMLSPSPSPLDITPHDAWFAERYMLANAITFGMALSLVVILPLIKNPPPKNTIVFVKVMLVFLAITAAVTFVLSTSVFRNIQHWVAITTALFAFYTILYVSGPILSKKIKRCFTR